MIAEAEDFLAESRALEALIAPLDEAALATLTAFKGWSILDVIGHLHFWNIAADLSLNDAEGFRAFFADAAKGMAAAGGMKPFERQWAKDLPGRALVEAWGAFLAPMAARFAAADPAVRVKWAGPDMSARSSITARLMETWAHGHEVYDALGVERINADRIRSIVVLGVNTYNWTFRNRGLEPPAPMPHLSLTAPSGAVWSFGDESEIERIEGPAEAFCQVVTQTRNVADTSLKITGPNAHAWMAIAQCFAGPPADPPAPGARRLGARGA